MDIQNDAERLIIQKHLEGDFEVGLFLAAIYNLSDENNLLRFSNYAYALRELFNHVIRRMAPSDNVEVCEWFAGLNERGNISRRDLYKYIIQGGLSDEYITNDLGLEVNRVYTGLRDAFNSMNRLTHISDKVFPIDNLRGRGIISEVNRCISDLFNMLESCHNEIIYKLDEKINNAAIEGAIFQSIESIDLLSTHSSVGELDINDVVISEINDSEIVFFVTGKVNVELQWGSNSDVRNDIGGVGEQSFPFSCQVRSSVLDPENVFCEEGAFQVDTASWWDGYYDDE